MRLNRQGAIGSDRACVCERENSSFFNHRIAAVALSLVLVFNNLHIFACNYRNQATSLPMPSTDAKMLSCLKQILLNKELPIISQSPIHSDGSPRTALNGKGREVPFLGAQFAHHGDTGDWRRWNKSIQMARAQPMPQLQQGTEESPCIVLEIGAHREAKSSQGHIKKYPIVSTMRMRLFPNLRKS